MRGGVGVGTILPISCVPWPSSLTLPHFQSRNSNGVDPCGISGLLDSACRGQSALSIPPTPTKSPAHQYLQTAVVFGALLNETNYVPPQKTSDAALKKCECNTVFYSLVVACSLCQIFAPPGPLK